MKDPERTSFLNKAKKFLSTPAGIALTLLCAAVFITGIVYLITTRKILYVGWNILHAPTMLLLNILPVLLALLLFFFLTRKIGFSCSLVGIVLIFFAVVDRVKVSMRQEPLLPTDLTLAKEVIAILKTFPVYQLVLIGVMLIVFAALPVCSFLKSNCRLCRGFWVLCLCLPAALGQITSGMQIKRCMTATRLWTILIFR